MKTFVKPAPLVICALSFLMLSCGGGDTPMTSRQLADSAEALSRSLLQVDGCSADSQCGYVTFQTPFHSCSQGEHMPLLLTSPGAEAAQTAAGQQRDWAAAARALEPPPDFACPAYVEPPPVPVCSQNRCLLKSGFTIFPVSTH